MAPLEEIQKHSLMELVDALRPFVDQASEAKRLVDIWDYSFHTWGWKQLEYKLVIVMRKDLNLRVGKMIAQACHGMEILDGLDPETKAKWERSHKKKICLRTDSQADFDEILRKTIDAGLRHHVVTDLGFTELKEPTVTCLVIGPDESSRIDAITWRLTLL